MAKTYYKLFRRRRGDVITLFHGVNGSRVVHPVKWLTAERKWAGEGGKKYWTGFHVMKSYNAAVWYLARFKNRNEISILHVLARGVKPKPNGTCGVMLANKIMLI